MDIYKILRPEVKDFQPYLPGKPIDEVRRELGLKKIVKLASNENALGTSLKAIETFRKNCDTLYLYPEGPGTLLRRAIAKKLNIKENEVILGAGSDEIIELLGKTFFRKEDEIIVSEHAFVRYKMAADLMGIKTIEVPMKNFTHDLESMAGQINHKTKAIFIANPNNPTGTYCNQKATAQFFSFIKSKFQKILSMNKPLIVFDEAYYEFSKNLVPDYPDTLSYFHQEYPIIILRTFSKVYGLAGLRVGYGIAKKEIIDALDRVRPPFNVSTPAQMTAIAALQDETHVRKSIKIVKEQMSYLVLELNKLGIQCLPSAANFLLMDVHPFRGRELFNRLLRKGVIVRAMDEYQFPYHVRVTVGLPHENQFFIKKLKEVYRG